MSAATEQSFLQRTAGKVALWVIPVVVIPLGFYYLNVSTEARGDVNASLNAHAIRLSTLEVMFAQSKEDQAKFQAATEKKLDRIEERQAQTQDASARILEELATLKALVSRN